jgi:hypothetical protein
MLGRNEGRDARKERGKGCKEGTKDCNEGLENDPSFFSHPLLSSYSGRGLYIHSVKTFNYKIFSQ